jgi:hypothetical protein
LLKQHKKDNEMISVEKMQISSYTFSLCAFIKNLVEEGIVASVYQP